MNSLGIDIGTQSLKVVNLRDGKTVLGQGAQAYEMRTPKPGWAEQDPSLWEGALRNVVADALTAAGIGASDIDAIAVAGQLDGCVAVDKHGNPLSPCLLWMDRRATAELPGVGASSQQDFQQRSGQVMDASHMAAKIRWLRANMPGLAGARFHQPTSYLVERLCGAFVYDHALASTTMLYNLKARGYDSELLQAFGIDEFLVPSIASANKIAGTLHEAGAKLCGLIAGIPVAVGTGDDFSTALGGGVEQAGPLLCVLGTAEVVGAVSQQALIDSSGLVETHGYLDHFFVENPGWLSGGARVWLRSLLTIQSAEELDALAAKAPPGCEGVTFLPALTGAMAPTWQANARACFYGLTNSHGPEHMARALLEGCAFAMLDVRSRLSELGLGQESILLVGGGARSELWAQIRADLCQVPVHRNEEAESSAIGAALLAHSAIDKGVSLTRLALDFPRSRQELLPQSENAAAYREAYQRYQALFAALAPMWD